jgi:hypothetical protein
MVGKENPIVGKNMQLMPGDKLPSDRIMIRNLMRCAGHGDHSWSELLRRELVEITLLRVDDRGQEIEEPVPPDAA